MRVRNIKSVLRNKINEWMESIDDQDVKSEIHDNVLVCGGSIANMLMGEKVNDFDVYLRTQDAALAIARYYVRKFSENPPPRFAGSDKLVGIEAADVDGRIRIIVKSQGIAGESASSSYRYFEQVDSDTASEQFVESVVKDAEETKEEDDSQNRPKYRPKFLTSNAITLSHRIQVVIRFVGDAETIHSNYDFAHCMVAWQSWDGALVIPQDALLSMMAKHLSYRGSQYPLCSIIRTRKFLARGWTIDAGQYVKMAFDLNALDLTDIDVLEDQMVGVDAAYFYEVLRLLREKGGNIERSYVVQIIDRVFG